MHTTVTLCETAKQLETGKK